MTSTSQDKFVMSTRNSINTFLKDLITIFYILLFKFVIQYEFTHKLKRLAITLNHSFMNVDKIQLSLDDHTATTTSTLDRIQPRNDCVSQRNCLYHKSIDGTVPQN